MLNGGATVFLLDVDNTLLDNDRFAADLGTHLQEAFGAAECARYWDIFAALREQNGVADYLASLQRFRQGLEDHPRLLLTADFMLDYPFAACLYAGAREVLAHLGRIGLPVVLSDGDVVFQPRKIRRAGIWEALDGRVMIYDHKERALERVWRRYPAPHYVAIDDKTQLLAAMKLAAKRPLTTVFVRQGHYAHADGADRVTPPPDRSIERIGDLLQMTLNDFEDTP
ncbi:MAG TPA: HAD family hydrolase [Steroidobacteraceae bacterium]|nr:HAD family hydrolase [Steroidobacteraceae bacterium]